MPTTLLETSDEIISRWRSSAGADNPAGPLYAAGPFVEADIAEPDIFNTTAICTYGPCSVCTASHTRDCC